MATNKADGTDEFPKHIFVTVEGDGADDTFLSATATHDVVGDGQKVAIYELREVKTKRVTHELE